ncbi:MAG: radical SAM protein [Myxococcales bacterium]|nr:MAG: radical SAM protein [Myxococcales bacterium]
MQSREIHPSDYYRLPWTLNDNVLCWLEPTKRCNLYCEGCYSRNDPKSDKSLERVRHDLDVFTQNRRVDSISIAGGEPIVHPHIVELVRMIHDDYHLKPVINTNGLALTPELLRELKKAGIYGFTFHIDSSQGRPGWKNKNELELCDLRLHYAKMVAEAGNICVAFNSTVFPHTLDYVPDLVEWAAKHVDIVHNMVFILFRTLRSNEFDYFANGQKVKAPQDVVYYDQEKNPKPLNARDIVSKIRERFPDYEPCAYLGGTKDPDSFKWLLASRLSSKERTYGYVGKKYIELVQNAHHMFAGRYLAYVRPSALRKGRSMMFAFSPFDRGVRKAARSFMRHAFRHPLRAASPVHFQSITIIQPIDMLANGEANMCDGCPDMTVHNDELVWSCRLEERLQYGCFLQAVPKLEESPCKQEALKVHEVLRWQQ